MSVRRISLLSKLESIHAVSRCAFIYGSRGIGKTTLVSGWIKDHKAKVLWMSLERQIPFEEVLAFEIDEDVEGKSAEWLLRKLSKSWSDYDYVVWDNFHFLSEHLKKVVVSFVNSRPQFPKQFILSDEQISHNYFPEIGRLEIEAFSVNEVSDFFEGKLDSKELENVFSKTSGIPLLLNLYSISKEGLNSFIGSEFEEMDASVIDFLKAWAVLGRSINENEVFSLAKEYQLNTDNFVEELSKRNIIKTFGRLENKLFELQKHIEVYFLENLSPNDISSITAKLVGTISSDSENIIESLSLALTTSDSEIIKKVLSHFPSHLGLQGIESISVDLQNELIVLVDKALGLKDLNVHDKVILNRFLMKLQIVRGQRDRAIEEITPFIDKYLRVESLSEHEKLFICEFTSFLNSYYKSEKARALCEQVIAYVDFETASYLKIEKAVSLMQNDINLSLSILQEVQKEITYSELKDNKKILSMLHFQLARCTYHLNDNHRALENYEKAAQIYKETGNLYFHAMCTMNTLWIYLRNENYEYLEKGINEIYPYAQDFSHGLVLAGLNLIKAKKFRHHLLLKNARESIDLALDYLGVKGPYFSLKDVLSEKIRVCLMREERIEAEQTFDLLIKKAREHNKEKDDDLVLLQKEILAYDSSKEELIESWEETSFKDGIEPYGKRFLLQYNIECSPIPAAPLYTCFQIEGRIRQLLESGANKEECLQQVIKLKKISTSDDINSFYILCSFFLKASGEEDTNCEDLLEKWSADERVKNIYRMWLSQIKGDENQIKWGDYRKGDVARLKVFVENSFGAAQAKYERLENGESSLCSQIKENPEKIKGYFIFIEDTGELWFNGSQIHEIAKRTQLKKLLAALFEVSPAALSKEDITTMVWGDSYDPLIHDARIYTSVQRLRELLEMEQVVVNIDNSYAWNPKLKFIFYRPRRDKAKIASNRNQTLILKCMEHAREQGSFEIGRSFLVEKTGLSESSIKREISQLLHSNHLVKVGAGRSIRYKLP